jgi:biotin carboxyl carrier protein
MHRYTIVVDGKPFTLDVRELGADQFRVHVDGRELDVRLGDDQELAEGSITPAIVLNADARAAASEVVSGSVLPMSRPRLVPSGSSVATLTAPMPGVIASVSVQAGAAVRRGDVLLALEAMKMVNDIRAPRDAVVDEVLVEKGQSVAFAELLLRFRESQ